VSACLRHSFMYKAMLDDKTLLTDPDSRATLQNAVRALAESDMLTVSGEFLENLKRHEAIMEASPDFGALATAKKVLGRVRKMAKLAVAIDWGVREVAGCKPSTPAEMRTVATGVMTKLASKNCSAKDGTMPNFLNKVLLHMLRKAEDLELALQQGVRADV
jgi:hypothetical protein